MQARPIKKAFADEQRFAREWGEFRAKARISD
jgi:hypothetical protein